MEINDLLDNMDIYEVDKNDYEAYFYRLPKNDLMKMTPRKGITIFKDQIENIYVCGTEIENIMGTKATRYFLFDMIEDTTRLGPPKYIKEIVLEQEEYENFLRKFLGERKENAQQDLSSTR